MKRGIMTEIDWKYVASILANEGDDVQSDFFKSFVAECNTWGTVHQVQMQMTNINAKLSDDEKETLSMIVYVGE